MIRVVLADDEELFREALRTLIGTFPGIEIVGEANTGEKALQVSKDLHPDVVLMDVSMPGMDGVTATAEIRRADPQVRVLAVSVHRGGSAVRAMLRAGASGYISKNARAGTLQRAIHRAATGGAYLDPEVSSTVIEQLLSAEPSKHAKGVLSPRELEVVRLIARGFGNQQTADKLGISVKTVESYRAHLGEKLGLHGRPEIVQYALQHGLLADDWR